MSTINVGSSNGIINNVTVNSATANSIIVADSNKKLTSATLSGLSVSGTTISTVTGGYLSMQSTNNQSIPHSTTTTIQFPTINSNTFGSNLTISGTSNTTFTNTSGSTMTLSVSALIPVFVNNTNGTGLYEGGSWIQDNTGLTYGNLNIYCPNGFYNVGGTGSNTYTYFPTNATIVLANGGYFVINVYLTQTSGNITISQNVTGLISTLVVKQIL